MKFTEQPEPVKMPPTLDAVPCRHVFQCDGGIYFKVTGVDCIVLKKGRETHGVVGDIVYFPHDMKIDAWYDEIILAGAHR